MALPANYNTVTVRGAYVNLDGSPATGSVTFTANVNPGTFLTDAGADVAVLPMAITAKLDGQGAFTIQLPASDDPDIAPSGFTYTVTEKFGNGQRSYSIQVPVAAAEVDLVTVAPVQPVTASVTLVRADQVGAPNGVASLDAGGVVPDAQLPAATATTAGTVQLAGDLGGSAEAPTVPSATTALTEVRARDVSAATHGMSTAATGTDNATALTDAATDASVAGARLILPAGAYNLDPVTIAPWSGMHIVGAGAIWENGTPGTRFTTTNNSGVDLLTVDGPDNPNGAWSVILSDFELVGQSGSGNGINIGGVGGDRILLQPLTVARVSSHHHGGSGIKLGGRIAQGLIEACISRNNGQHGYLLSDFGLLAELTIIASHGNANADHGLLLGSTFNTFTTIGSEYASNAIGVEVTSGLGGSIAASSFIGCHFEHNSVYHAQFGARSVGPVRVQGCRFLDNLKTLPASINIRDACDQMVIEDCHVDVGKANAVVVQEGRIARQSRVFYRNNYFGGPSPVYLRKTSSGVLTNVVNGGPTADRWTDVAVPGDQYYDTDLNKPLWWNGTAWVDATGTAV